MVSAKLRTRALSRGKPSAPEKIQSAWSRYPSLSSRGSSTRTSKRRSGGLMTDLSHTVRCVRLHIQRSVRRDRKAQPVIHDVDRDATTVRQLVTEHPPRQRIFDFLLD